MELIRSDEVVALNEAIVAARDGAARLRAAAEDVETDRAAHFTAEADRLEARAEVLADAVRARDDLPDSPADETVLIEQAITRLQALFSDHDAVLNEVASRVDETLRETVERCRPQIADEAALAALEELRVRF